TKTVSRKTPFHRSRSRRVFRFEALEIRQMLSIAAGVPMLYGIPAIAMPHTASAPVPPGNNNPDNQPQGPNDQNPPPENNSQNPPPQQQQQPNLVANAPVSTGALH